MYSLCVSSFLAIRVTLTTQPTIDEDAGVLKVTLSLDRPSPCCLRVYVKTIDVSAEGKLLVLCVHMCICVHVCMSVCVCVFVCEQVCVSVRANTCECVHATVCMYMCMQLCAFVCKCACVHASVCMQVHAWEYVCMYTYECTNMHVCASKDI